MLVRRCGQKETINVLKKDRSIDLTFLKNREKTAMIDAGKDRYPLSLLLKNFICQKAVIPFKSLFMSWQVKISQ